VSVTKHAKNKKIKFSRNKNKKVTFDYEGLNCLRLDRRRSRTLKVQKLHI